MSPLEVAPVSEAEPPLELGSPVAVAPPLELVGGGYGCGCGEGLGVPVRGRGVAHDGGTVCTFQLLKISRSLVISVSCSLCSVAEVSFTAEEIKLIS